MMADLRPIDPAGVDSFVPPPEPITRMSNFKILVDFANCFFDEVDINFFDFR